MAQKELDWFKLVLKGSILLPGFQKVSFIVPIRHFAGVGGVSGGF